MLDNILFTTLKKTYKKLKFLQGARSFFGALILFVLALRLAYLADYHLHLTLSGRVIVMGMLVGVMGVVLLSFFKICIRPFSAEKTALLVEKSFPSLQDSLISAVQLSQKQSAYVSQSLVGVTVEKAKQTLTGMPLGRVLPFGPFWKTFCLFFLIAGANAMPYTLDYESSYLYGIFWQRCVEFRDVPWPKDVILRISIQGDYLKNTGSHTYSTPEGAKVYLSVKVERGTPKKIELVPSQKNLPPIPFQKKEKNIYELAWAPPASTEFIIRGGDFESRLYKLNIRPYPTLTIQYKKKYPSYLKMANDREWYSWSNLEDVWWGTEIEFIGRANKPLVSALLKINNHIYQGSGLEIIQQKDGTCILQGKLLAEGDKLVPAGMSLLKTLPLKGEKPSRGASLSQFSFSFLLVDRDDMENPSPQEFQITVKRDLPPLVRIITPSQPIEMTPRGKFNLRFRVEDDFAIKSATVVMNVFKGKKKLFSITRNIVLKERAITEKDFYMTLEGREIHHSGQTLKVGQKIELQVEARDFKDIRPLNVGLSDDKAEIWIVSDNKILVQFKRFLDEAEGRLRETLQDEILARRVLRKVALSQKLLAGKPTLEDLENISSSQNIQHGVTRGIKEGRRLIQKALQLILNNQVKGEEERLPTLKLVEKILGEMMTKDATALSKELNQLLNKPTLDRVRMARELQEKMAQTLEDLLGKLNKWGGFDEIIQDFRDLKQGQETILKKTFEAIQNK